MEQFRHPAVLVRAFDRLHLMNLDKLALAGAVREVFESAVCMGRQALLAIGIEEDEVDRVETEYRRRDIARLGLQTEAGDLGAGREIAFDVDRPIDPELQR
ncbi:MAG: sodium:proton exchanger [Sphingomonas bacterium]|nr:sodium:proton exchanger [Sphingomonas bacterium]